MRIRAFAVLILAISNVSCASRDYNSAKTDVKSNAGEEWSESQDELHVRFRQELGLEEMTPEERRKLIRYRQWNGKIQNFFKQNDQSMLGKLEAEFERELPIIQERMKSVLSGEQSEANTVPKEAFDDLASFSKMIKDNFHAQAAKISKPTVVRFLILVPKGDLANYKVFLVAVVNPPKLNTHPGTILMPAEALDTPELRTFYYQIPGENSENLKQLPVKNGGYAFWGSPIKAVD
jgi:hypothetical protein